LRASLCALWLFVPGRLGAQEFGFNDCMLPPGTSFPGAGNAGRIADDGTGTNCCVHLTDVNQGGSFGVFFVPDQAAGNNVDHVHMHWRSLVGGDNGRVCTATQFDRPGADGYSMSWGTDLPNPPGYGNPGEEGAGTGLIVTVDTFDNGGGEAPGLEIKWKGSRVAFDNINADQGLAKDFLRKGVFVEADVTVDVSGNATFTYDGRVLTATLAGWSGIAGGSFMFGSRTGGACDNQWIDDLVITAFGPGSDFKLDWFAVAAGGGDSSGGDFKLSATIGQPDAGNVAGGDFAITGGFWSILTVSETPGAPSLNVSLAEGSVIISWPDSGSAGFDLEETAALANPSANTLWTTVNVTPTANNGTKSVRLPLAAGNRFYRLHKP